MLDSSIPKSKRFGYRKRPMPPEADLIAEARRIYAYSAEHKSLIWREHKNPLRPWPPLGTVAGGDDGHGYRMCLLLGHKFKVHQVVWMVLYGEFPPGALDHKNGDKLDNSPENLRLASDLQNAQNRLGRLALTGIKRNPKGVNRPYAAVVQHLGKKLYFGSYATPEEAHRAYVEGKRKICGEYSRY